jgi:hypothetical protein
MIANARERHGMTPFLSQLIAACLSGVMANPASASRLLEERTEEALEQALDMLNELRERGFDV